MSGIWEKIRETVAEGRLPKVRLPASTEIVPSKTRENPHGEVERGKRKGSLTYALHKGKTFIKCVAPGCRRWPEVQGNGLTCSDACTELLREYCRVVLQVLDGERPAHEFPSYFRFRNRSHDNVGITEGDWDDYRRGDNLLPKDPPMAPLLRALSYASEVPEWPKVTEKRSTVTKRQGKI